MHRENNPYICPYNSCGLIVKLKDFNQHTLDLSLSIHVEGANFYFMVEERDIDYTGPWEMLCMRAHNVYVHVCLAYFRPLKCYALSVWSSTAGVAKYQANMKICKRDGDYREMSIGGLLITSVEKVPSIDKCMEKNGDYFWCIPERRLWPENSSWLVGMITIGARFVLSSK